MLVAASLNGVDMIIDSGCSSHIINNNVLFDSYHTIKSGRYVRVANGMRLPVLGVGSLGPLRHVLHVPGIDLNLISVRQLDSEGHSVTFKGGRCFLGSTLFGTLSGKLYSAKIMPSCLDTTATISDVEDPGVEVISAVYSVVNTLLPADIALLHRRFGHADVAMIRRMIAHGSATGVLLLAIPTRSTVTPVLVPRPSSKHESNQRERILAPTTSGVIYILLLCGATCLDLLPQQPSVVLSMGLRSRRPTPGTVTFTL